jgi:uncharacterized protein YnzC (UPF0291/DUF896 family)
MLALTTFGKLVIVSKLLKEGFNFENKDQDSLYEMYYEKYESNENYNLYTLEDILDFCPERANDINHLNESGYDIISILEEIDMIEDYDDAVREGFNCSNEEMEMYFAMSFNSPELIAILKQYVESPLINIIIKTLAEKINEWGKINKPKELIAKHKEQSKKYRGMSDSFNDWTSYFDNFIEYIKGKDTDTILDKLYNSGKPAKDEEVDMTIEDMIETLFNV